MAELKVYIWHVMWNFKNYKNTAETAKKICVYGKSVITDRQVWNWFLKFCSWSTSLCGEPDDQDASRELVECNPFKSTWELILDLNTSICHRLKRIEKVSKLGVWVPHSVYKWE